MASERGTEEGSRRGAIIVALIVVGVLAWNIIAWRVIGDRPRTWSYGAARAIPAESYASSEPPPAAAQAPKQVELPPPIEGRSR